MNLLLGWLVLMLAGGLVAAGPQTLVVSANGPYTTIQAALDQAVDGDTIEVRGGQYTAPLVVEKSVSLIGIDTPVIDGGGAGTVVTLAAPDILFSGFSVRGSGSDPDRDHAGITVKANHVVVQGNTISDVLFGVFVSQSDDVIVRGNNITSKAEFDLGRKGDAVRLWYSQRAIIEDNEVHHARDLVLWYGEAVIVRNNIIRDGRYGVHLMYCNNSLIEGNQLLDNSVGIYTMYSSDVTLRQNLLRGHRGASGYAFGFKDADNVEVTGNVVVDNHVGAFLDGTPFSPSGWGRYSENIFAFNEIGVVLLPAVTRNSFESNTFWENNEQVAVQGGGAVGNNIWSGNYWSDYDGFDVDGDGFGDTPYSAERFFESLTDREPRLRALAFSPAVQAAEFAARTFPVVRPQPKLQDDAPRISPAAPPAFAIYSSGKGGAMGIAAAALLATGALTAFLGFVGRRQAQPTATARAASTQPALQVNQLTKRYGKTEALQNISFEAQSGEAIALWGANGAGKTTLIKAALGLIEFEGDITVAGHSVRHRGKDARRSVGYVPQETAFYDLTTEATMRFYARIKKVDEARLAELLTQLGLTAHAHKPVSALSGGLKQRLALAVALLADPPLLLLDEPTASLDTRARRDYLKLLAQLRRAGKTIVFASHRLDEIESLADKVLVLEHGLLAGVCSPEQLRADTMPLVALTMWIADAQREAALSVLQTHGVQAHFNGRGTVVATVRAADKATVMARLAQHGIQVSNFELEVVGSDEE